MAVRASANLSATPSSRRACCLASPSSPSASSARPTSISLATATSRPNASTSCLISSRPSSPRRALRLLLLRVQARAPDPRLLLGLHHALGFGPPHVLRRGRGLPRGLAVPRPCPLLPGGQGRPR